MRKLFRFTLGFAGALGCILWLCWEKSAWVCAAGWAAAMGLLLLSHWAPYSKRLFAAALGFALGASLVFGLQKTYYEPLLALDDTVREVEVLCRENSAPGQYSHSVRGDLRYNGKTYPVRLYLPEGMTARAGDNVSGPFRLRVTLPGGSRAGGTYPGVENLMPYVDYLIPSEEFALKMTGEKSAEEAAQKLYMTYQPEVLVLTQGSRGGVLLDEKGMRRYDCYKVEVKDSNGCGDTFHGAFVAAKIKGMTNDQACKYASAAAAIKCTRLGARYGMANDEECRAFLQERGVTL